MIDVVPDILALEIM